MNKQVITTFQILFFLSFACASSLFGQSDTFQLKEFLSPDLKRKTQVINPDVRLTDSKETYLSNTDRKGSFGYLDLYLSSSEFINTRKRQSTLNLYNRVGYKSLIDTINYPSQYEPNNKFYSSHDIRWVNRLYLNPKLFFETKAFGRLAYNRFLSLGNNGINLEADITPSIGIGRIEAATDAWLALSIFNALRDNGLLIREPNGGEIEAFSIAISQLKNYRSRDSRLENIYEFETLCTFLVKNGYIDPNDYRVFAILKDAYDFEGFVYRGHGSRLQAGVTSDLERNKSKDLSTNTSFMFNSVLVSYTDHNAINENWQFNQTYSLRYGKLNYKYQDDDVFDGELFSELSAQLSLGYYFSRRTYAVCSVNFINRYFEDNFERRANEFVVALDYYYYLSPKTRFFVNADFSNNTYDYVSNSTLDRYTNLFLGLNYFIH